MVFSLYSLRFSFIAREPVVFPAGKSSNILRGAFGTIFRRIACVPECSNARDCQRRAGCPYAQIFEPSAAGERPSGLADSPRPFVFRAMHLDGRQVEAGKRFHFDLNLFDANSTAIAYLVLAFAQLAREGLGPSRGRVELVEVGQLDGRRSPGSCIYDGHSLRQPVEPLSIDLAAAEQARRVRVQFVTPTELKSGHEVVARPEFGIVAARIRDRVSALRELYGAGPLEIDFRGFGERAGRVRMTRCELQRVDVMRRSSRTGQRHGIGGFVGEAEYEGELSEFVPYLRAAEWTGVGRHTVWGKGEIRVGATNEHE